MIRTVHYTTGICVAVAGEVFKGWPGVVVSVVGFGLLGLFIARDVRERVALKRVNIRIFRSSQAPRDPRNI